MRGRHNLIARWYTRDPTHIIRACDQGKYIATMAHKPLATAAVNRKEDQCSRFSERQTWHLMD